MTDFSKKVIAIVKRVPKGKVATYMQIAKLAGKPHAARGVAWLLNSSSRAHKLPWHRIINSKGAISFLPFTQEHARQRKALEKENVEFSETGRIDFAKFRWKCPATKRKLRKK